MTPQPLSKSGLRTTSHRQNVLGRLAKIRTPVSVDDLRVHLSQIDRVTLYRMLEQFTAVGLTTRVIFNDGVRRYELGSRPHHHHLVCNNCGKIQDFQVKGKTGWVKAAARQYGFRPTNHSMEIFGLCANCQ